MTGLYIELFNGNKFGIPMSDCGEPGPVLGPFQLVTSHFNQGLKVWTISTREADALRGEIVVVGDLLYYDGCYYADWTIMNMEIIEYEHHHAGRIQAFDPEKAKYVKRQSSKARAYLHPGRPIGDV